MSFELRWIFFLLVLFQLKHFVADFPLQFDYMLKKRNPDWTFFVPLLSHVVTHGVLTFLIVLLWNPLLWWLVFLDMTTHFLMDRIKSGPKYLGRYSDTKTRAHWLCFGLDQMVHHLNHYLIIWILITTGRG